MRILPVAYSIPTPGLYNGLDNTSKIDHPGFWDHKWRLCCQILKSKSIPKGKRIVLKLRGSMPKGVNGRENSLGVASRPGRTLRPISSELPPVSSDARSSRLSARPDQRTNSNADLDSARNLEDSPGPSNPNHPSLERRKQEIVDNVMSMFTRWLDLRLGASDEAHDDGDDPGSRQDRSPNSGSGNGKGSQQNNRPKKRQQRDGSPGGSGGDDGQDGKEYKKARKAASEISRPRYACPFYKHDPGSYKRRVCQGPGWLSVHRVKEHIYRCHLMPKHLCHRCYQAFSSATALAAHHREVVACRRAELTIHEGLNEATEKLLRARATRKDESKSEEEKWRDMYKIIYPDAPDDVIPSPYYNTSGSRELDGCAQYLRRELPPRVRKQLEYEVEKRLHCVQEDVKKDAINIIQQLALSLVRAYRFQDADAAPPSSVTALGAGEPDSPPATVADYPAEDILGDPEMDLFYGDFDLEDFMVQPLDCLNSNDSAIGDAGLPGEVGYDWRI